jgi:hypothetical protein
VKPPRLVSRPFAKLQAAFADLPRSLQRAFELAGGEFEVERCDTLAISGCRTPSSL